jgi:hypothetical protein
MIPQVLELLAGLIRADSAGRYYNAYIRGREG